MKGRKKLTFVFIQLNKKGGSSIGINKAVNKEELINAIKEARKYDKKIIVEKFMKVRELECAVLEKNNLICSIPGEIVSANEFYDYDAKYLNNKSYTTIAYGLKEEVINKIKEYSSKIFINLGLKDYARIDYFYDDKNNLIYINEVNTIPGFTSISMFPKLMEYEGVNYKDLIAILINNT